MSIKRFDTFTAICDWPECGADVMESSDYGGWGEMDALDTEMEDADWRIGADGTSHYCDKHPVQWVGTRLDGDPEPPRPYLLIHDGDTGNFDDDGKVTLILAETVRLIAEGNAPLPIEVP
ncbi:hypothetical protein [Nocardioides sp. WS12]|uniref:hypothetical protein n=1 Tax=Nocardioides sp. WS12 TaxID=2486272 RepID=UPI0015FC1CA6|nr:hypothetical protein [Nocardioides sp. WS12]